MININEVSVGIVGLGLMGGSFAKALRNKCGVPRERLFACDMDAETLAAAKNEGLISRSFEPDGAGELLASCGLVFLCLNPSVILNFLPRWEAAFQKDSLVTDIAGIKGSIAEAAANFRPDVDFIPGHPMAGAEKNGFANLSLCDFTNKNYILTPLPRNKSENLAFLKDLIYRMGFGRVTEVTPAEHDRKIAFTSQLCHVIAAALIDCESDTKITRFGGGSFEDLTRIAIINAPMWTELFIENRAALLERIEQFEGSLDALKLLIGGSQSQLLEEKLTHVRERRTEMSAR